MRSYGGSGVTDADITAAVDAHEAESDPHPSYALDTDIDALGWKPAVRVVTDTVVASLSGEQTISGVALVAGDRLILVGQGGDVVTPHVDNGAWRVAAGAWTRPADYDASADVTSGAAWLVREGGNGLAHNIVQLVTAGTVVVGTTPTAFALVPPSIEADNVAYTPVDGTAWADPDPTTVAEALDALAAAPAGVTSLERFWQIHAVLPAVNPAGVTSRNGHPLLAFDDTVAESAIFQGLVSRDYAGGALTVDLLWCAATAVAGDVKWDVAFEALTPGGQDLDADGFAAAQSGTSTTHGTSGVLTRTSIAFTQAQADAIAAGDAYRLSVARDPAVVGDLTGDAQLLSVEVRQ